MKTRQCAEFISKNHETIFEIWESRVNSEVTAASKTPDLIVRNYLPKFLDSLVDALKSYDPAKGEGQLDDMDTGVFHSQEHGRARASVSHYDLRQVLHEYAILRQVIREQLLEHQLLCFTVVEIIDRQIESSCQDAGQLFVDSVKSVQDKLISIVAHDLRNPISVATSYIDIGEHGLLETNKVYAAIKRNLNKALHLISELLDANNVKAGHGMTFRFKKGDMVEEVKRTWKEANDIYSNEIELQCDLSSAPGVYDSTTIHRAMENLLSNAIKYGGKKARVTISLDVKDDAVILGVHNTGSFIPDEQQESIFSFLSRREDTSTNGKEGWGLGLYLVAIVARAHKGTAWVESTNETGTAFYMKLDPKAREENTTFSSFL